MSHESRTRLERILLAINSAELAELAEANKQAAAAFEADMQPVCNAVVEALQSGDLDALRGLRALLPNLLEEVNDSPALADVLAHQLGKTLLEGFQSEVRDQKSEANS